MNAKNVGYWITTILIVLAMGSGGYFEVIREPSVVKGMRELGYPDYFTMTLGVWKILAVVALLSPGLPRLKEWAYAGILFDLSGAMVSHIVHRDNAMHIITPAVICVISLISWALRPPSRRLGTIIGSAQHGAID